MVRIVLIFLNRFEAFVWLFSLFLFIPWRQTLSTFVKMAPIENLVIEDLVYTHLVITLQS